MEATRIELLKIGIEVLKIVVIAIGGGFALYKYWEQRKEANEAKIRENRKEAYIKFLHFYSEYLRDVKSSKSKEAPKEKEDEIKNQLILYGSDEGITAILNFIKKSGEESERYPLLLELRKEFDKDTKITLKDIKYLFGEEE